VKALARERRSRDTWPQPAGRPPATPCNAAQPPPPPAMKRLALLLLLAFLALAVWLAARGGGGARRDPVERLVAEMVQIPGRDFRMGKYEVTQAQWEAVMGKNPSKFKGADHLVGRQPGVSRKAQRASRRACVGPRLPPADGGRMGNRLPRGLDERLLPPRGRDGDHGSDARPRGVVRREPLDASPLALALP